MPLRLSDCLELDSQLNSESALADAIKRFHQGQEATLYFDANSIGPMPRHLPEKMQEFIEELEELLKVELEVYGNKIKLPDGCLISPQDLALLEWLIDFEEEN